MFYLCGNLGVLSRLTLWHKRTVCSRVDGEAEIKPIVPDTGNAETGIGISRKDWEKSL